MKNSNEDLEKPSLSYWWRKGLVIILIFEFSVLIWVTTGSYYRNSQPPIQL